MPTKRHYNIRGTNDFLILAAIFFFLGLWAIKDAWFPSEKVLKKHPLEMAVAFETEGAVKDVLVEVGDTVAEKQLLAELRSDRASVQYDLAKSAYTENKKGIALLKRDLQNLTDSGAPAGEIAEVQSRLDELEQGMEEALSEVDELRTRLDACRLESPGKGKVMEVLVDSHTMVKPGQAAIILDPKDTFYLFNKSLTVLSAILFSVFLSIHILAR